ncbi:polysaccharide pyruvyl transferase family protein [Ancylobacter sp. Lp-2]|uniref:polysaccharide pyruvyl transferase family protein n=1 Tax=Ancylobacter sp. Lp-2 TaxID=2881339 RepID=UPI001E325BBA|nr:polysaccharide pyruvyl transferase family protein [Ancylobacter sp. Lp-2]MCB4768489.1 polysaccharide pyruvyl transferase family protein [Ancylobacter sp. Lp-2]
MSTETASLPPVQDPLQILLTGTFDVRNYGDLLFPLLAAQRLAPFGIEVTACSPSGVATGWADTMPPLPVSALMQPPFPLKGILVGGGNIVHARDSRLTDYKLGDLSSWAYAALWLGASIAGAVHNVPVAWNAPGVPNPLPDRLRDHVLIQQLAEAADYVAVRDAASRANLGRAAPLARIVPDTAAALAALWPRRSLEADFAALVERKAMPREARFMTVHVKARSVTTSLPQLATEIEAFAAARGLVPILLALAPCHDDDATARHLGRFMTGPRIVADDTRGLREIAGAIAHAELHLGSSMHGYVTAAAYDVPSVLVARPALAKFEGFLGHIGRDADRVADWSHAFPRAAEQLAAPSDAPLIPAAVLAALDDHWAQVAQALLHPPRTMVERARFLRSFVRCSVERDGWGPTLHSQLDAS